MKNQMKFYQRYCRCIMQLVNYFIPRIFIVYIIIFMFVFSIYNLILFSMHELNSTKTNWEMKVRFFRLFEVTYHKKGKFDKS